MALRIGGVEFDDVRLTFPEFGKMKGDKTAAVWTKGFGSLPLLEHGDFSIA